MWLWWICGCGGTAPLFFHVGFGVLASGFRWLAEGFGGGFLVQTQNSVWTIPGQMNLALN
jgi:hypothetical protein